MPYEYSLEVPHQDASNEYPQRMFSCMNKYIYSGQSLLSRAMIIVSKCSIYPENINKYIENKIGVNVLFTVLF